MKCARCGTQVEIDDKFCVRCGTPRSRLPPQFAQVERRYLNLRAGYRAGTVPEATYRSVLKNLTVRDPASSHWMLAEDGDWRWHNGQSWVRRDPPAAPAAAPAPGPTGTQRSGKGVPWAWIAAGCGGLCLLAICAAMIMWAAVRWLPTDLSLVKPTATVLAMPAQKAPAERAVARVGPGGGEIDGPGGVKVIVPEDALWDETEVVVARLDVPPAPPPNAVSASAAYEVILPEGVESQRPLHVVLPLERQPGLADDAYAAHRWDGHEWQFLGGHVQGDVFHVHVSHFSSIEVLACVLDNYRTAVFVHDYDQAIANVRPWAWTLVGERYCPGVPRYTKIATEISTEVGLLPCESGPCRYAYTALPWGTYTSWCVEWSPGDLDGDNRLDWVHFFLNSTVTLGKDSCSIGDYQARLCRPDRIDFSLPGAGGALVGICPIPPRGGASLPVPTSTAVAGAPTPTATSTATLVPGAPLPTDTPTPTSTPPPTSSPPASGATTSSPTPTSTQSPTPTATTVPPGPTPTTEGGVGVGTVALFTDNAFAASDWSATKIIDDQGSGTFAASQQSSGGNPTSFRHLRHDWSGPGNILTVHLHNGAVYDPSEKGAILSINVSFDLRLFEGGSSSTVNYLPLLVQNGTYYRVPRPSSAAANAWQTFAYENLVASDWVRLSGPGPENPDFSAGGGSIQFGYAASNGRSMAGSTATESGVDNWFVLVFSSLF